MIEVPLYMKGRVGTGASEARNLFGYFPGTNPGTGTAYIPTALPTVGPYGVEGSGGERSRSASCMMAWLQRPYMRPYMSQRPYMGTSLIRNQRLQGYLAHKKQG